jgi:hypothetical protein
VRKSAAGQGRNEVFEDISKRSGAFIKLPAYGDRVCSRYAVAKESSNQAVDYQNLGRTKSSRYGQGAVEEYSCEM